MRANVNDEQLPFRRLRLSLPMRDRPWRHNHDARSTRDCGVTYGDASFPRTNTDCAHRRGRSRSTRTWGGVARRDRPARARVRRRRAGDGREGAPQAMGVMAREGGDGALVFTDIRLPGLLDGVDLARRIKALWPHVSMVVTSGFERARPDKLPDNVAYMPKPWLALDVLMQAERAAEWMQRAQRV